MSNKYVLERASGELRAFDEFNQVERVAKAGERLIIIGDDNDIKEVNWIEPHYFSGKGKGEYFASSILDFSLGVPATSEIMEQLGRLEDDPAAYEQFINMLASKVVELGLQQEKESCNR